MIENGTEREIIVDDEYESLSVNGVMTAFEIISIFIGILSLLLAVGELTIAFLNFLEKRNIKKK